LLARFSCVLRARHNADAFDGDKRQQPIHRLLNHRLVADQIQQLFRAMGAAARPQACAAAACEYDGVKVFHKKVSSIQ
jgi:hypothetical protein